MKALVTGGAGFVGSHLVDRLLAAGHRVVVYDNLSTGQEQFLRDAQRCATFQFVHGDTLDPTPVEHALQGVDIVFHLAANADVRFGTEHPRKDVEQNTVATLNVLEAMRRTGVRRVVFASSGSIYGEPAIFPTPETCPFPVQTSLYGASKLACEGLISAYCYGFGFQAHIFRFVSLLGERYSHGHVFDFCKKLLIDSTQIEILGDGRQRKSYLYVQDCIDAIFVALERAGEPLNLFNLGSAGYCTVDESLEWICSALGVMPRRRYTGGERGWVGDSPFVFLDTARIRALGWQPQLSIRDAVIRTLTYLRANPWLLKRC